MLFPRGLITPVSVPPVWTARVLLTPAGGVSDSPILPSDQLVIGSLIYDASVPSERLMRVRLYLLESRNYYDLLFKTSGEETEWWWLISSPARLRESPSKAYGPFATPAAVPTRDFLARSHFSHAGTWKMLGRTRDVFSGALNDTQAATWYWFDSGADRLARIMNIRAKNDYHVAVLGAYYLVDFPNFRRLPSSNLGRVHEFCFRSATHATPTSPMLTLPDILTTMGAPPSGSQTKCTLEEIQALIPGISCPTKAVVPPSWSNRVHHECYMIGLPPFPYYGQVWYDWSRGMQVTVLVGKSDDGVYRQRTDMFLPKGKQDGPRIYYNWNSSNWIASCQEALGVPMPRPDFVKAGHGRCRAILKNNPYFGSLKLWSVRLGQKDRWFGNFWYWFDERERQVIFSLDPPHSLSLIDFQTFIRNAAIKSCLLAQPSDLPACPPPPVRVATAQELHYFMSLAAESI